MSQLIASSGKRSTNSYWPSFALGEAASFALGEAASFAYH